MTNDKHCIDPPVPMIRTDLCRRRVLTTPLGSYELTASPHCSRVLFGRHDRNVLLAVSP